MGFLDWLGRKKCEYFRHDLGFQYENKCPSCAKDIKELFDVKK